MNTERTVHIVSLTDRCLRGYLLQQVAEELIDMLIGKIQTHIMAIVMAVQQEDLLDMEVKHLRVSQIEST